MGDGGEPNEKKDGGAGKGGERRQGRREETNSQHILAKQQTLSSCSLKRCDAPVLLLPAPSRPGAWQGLAVGWDLLWDLGFWGAADRQGSLGPGFEGWGDKGLSWSPGGLCWARHVGRSHLDAWGSARMHTHITSRCAVNLEASFPWRKSHRRKREHPTKTLEVLRFGPGSSRQPPAGHTLPALGRGQSPSLPPRALCKPPAHRPNLLPSSPRGWEPPADPRAPSHRLQRGSGVGVGVSLKPCSYGAAPHRDQRAQPRHRHSQRGGYREQARAKYRHKTSRLAREAPPDTPPATPSWDLHTRIAVPLLGKGWIPSSLVFLRTGRTSLGPPQA